jgi:hypothetical protein
MEIAVMKALVLLLASVCLAAWADVAPPDRQWSERTEWINLALLGCTVLAVWVVAAGRLVFVGWLCIMLAAWAGVDRDCVRRWMFVALAATLVADLVAPRDQGGRWSSRTR